MQQRGRGLGFPYLWKRVGVVLRGVRVLMTKEFRPGGGRRLCADMIPERGILPHDREANDQRKARGV